MKYNYLNIYNNLIKLTRNKNLYKKVTNKDSFSDRLVIFLIHFAFFLKIFKKNTNKKELQRIYDFVFRQIELSIREIGYGDMTINKKMKTYINTLYAILHNIDNWENLNNHDKDKVLTILPEINNINNELNGLYNPF